MQISSQQWNFRERAVTLEDVQLFGVPVAKAAVYDTPALRDQFLAEILRRYAADNVKKHAEYESDRIHTSFGLENEHQVLHPMPAAYDQLLRRFVATSRFHVRIWHSVYWSGHEYQEPRHQLPSHISIMHFLCFDQSEHKRPIFYAPDGLTRAHCRRDAIQPDLWSEETRVEFYEGDALVFPSYLEYSISPGEYRKPMVIVSLGVTLLDTGPGGYLYGG